MGLTAIDHVNLRTPRLEAARAFYGDALGLEACDNGESGGQGYRLGVSERALVHLIPDRRAVAPERPQIEHFAFRATGLRLLMERLDRLDVGYNLYLDEPNGVVRVNLRDPDDNRLHVDFPIDEYLPGMAPSKVSLR